ncbi:helix-turn-helix transcriptional regulator [Sphingomonas jatrophae]|uniref:Helix-turn-helix domain-containing protein n=1 Tax=Sphingomonas jatrophae TaxID=1166337 RepID=A0A1I6KC04_9SPHN|nr:helix-turn-helix transcriptional regulator [Sphingomonas jatrophae]SFR88749.1 Helix-turn-helix domain-containing protein [Sphingomonas jatrophae]
MTGSDRLPPRATGTDWRRRELASFLRARRTGVSPEAFGIEPGRQRRTTGLRREEVAQLLGVSPSWYTKLEQGLDVTASPRLLVRIADVLCLSAMERAQLLRLGSEETPTSTAPAGEVLPPVQMIIDAMSYSPAFVLTPRADYIASNAAAVALFGDFKTFAGPESNQLLSLFLDENTRRSLPDWRESARQQVAMFRTAFARNIHDPGFHALIERLLAESDYFRELWARYELPSGSSREVQYRPGGAVPLTFRHFTFFADLDGQFRVEVFSPIDEGTTRFMMARMS